LREDWPRTVEEMEWRGVRGRGSGGPQPQRPREACASRGRSRI